MEWLKDILGDSLFDEVSSKLEGKQLLLDDGGYISKQKYDEIINQSEGFKAQMDELKKIKEDAEAKLVTSTAQGDIKMAALKKGAKDPDDVLAFADVNAFISGDKGVDDIICDIVNKKPYLFGIEPTPNGANPAGFGDTDIIARQFEQGIKGVG